MNNIILKEVLLGTGGDVYRENLGLRNSTNQT